MSRNELIARAPSKRPLPEYLFLLIGTTLALVLACVTGCAQAKSTERPNIVLVLIDTLRADHLPTYGYGTDTAPHIHRIAQGGVVFERVIAPSSWTKTSMASIMTGLNPPHHGVLRVDDALPGPLTTLAEILSANGYFTVGVNTNPWLMETSGFDAGYDRYESFSFLAGEGTAQKVNAEAIEALRKRPRDRPLFLYLHYMDVHAPYRPEAPFFSGAPLNTPDKGVVSNWMLDHLYRQEAYDGPGVQKRIHDLYDGGIRTVDAAIGHLFDHLMKQDLLRNTILVITADHGESFREHRTVTHGKNLYPEVYEVPLIFSAPGYLPKGIRIDSQIRSIDIAPTLLELAGVGVPEGFEGEPLVPMKPEAIKDRIALSEVGLNDYLPDLDFRAVVSRDHLYIRERTHDVVEFYDLGADPGAYENLGPNHPMAALYADFEASTQPQATNKDKQNELDAKTREELKSLGYLQ